MDWHHRPGSFLIMTGLGLLVVAFLARPLMDGPRYGRDG